MVDLYSSTESQKSIEQFLLVDGMKIYKDHNGRVGNLVIWEHSSQIIDLWPLKPFQISP